jgi:two-component system phosphate regulon response regulator PhoB
LVILDIMMPELNGLQVCRMLRADAVMKSVPIIFLTARGEAEDRVKGFETGADDYMPKPFDTRELLLRVQAIFKRLAQPNGAPAEKIFQLGKVVVDVEKHQLTVRGQEVELTATEFRLLRLLIESTSWSTSGTTRRTSRPVPWTRTSAACAKSWAQRRTSSKPCAA